LLYYSISSQQQRFKKPINEQGPESSMAKENTFISLEYFLLPPEGSSYKDRKYEGGIEEFEENLKKSSTLYVGNLSFFTTEEQISTLFSKCGPIKKIIMGLDRNKKTPCGFAFIEYYQRNFAIKSKSFLDGIKLD
jgi:RNA recognition motif-containing protein